MLLPLMSSICTEGLSQQTPSRFGARARAHTDYEGYVQHQSLGNSSEHLFYIESYLSMPCPWSASQKEKTIVPDTTLY